MSDRLFNSRDLIPSGDPDFWEVADSERDGETIFVRPPTSYRHAFGDKSIRLGLIEFRILLFLASRPYHAFTRRQIVHALTTEFKAAAEPSAGESFAIDQAAIDGHITTLRDQLGVLADFVQTVPGVGWRYKA
jgi:DNA-binding response OmpR family regulator